MHLRLDRVVNATCVLFFGCLAMLGPYASSASASTTLVFREPHKGSTFHFIDTPPSVGRVFFSPGDEVIFTERLEQEGKIVGKIRIICTATESSNNAIKAGLLCNILATIPGGTLAMVSPFAERGNRKGREGAVVGGTGKYAGARGTFRDEEGRRFDTNTITLLE
jgi:hypothetical protein